MLTGKSVLVTGGTGSFGKKFVETVLARYPEVERLVIFSRDELKQFEMAQTFSPTEHPQLRYFIGGVKDVALGLTLLGDDFVAEHAVDAALRFGKISVIKRLGVLVESVVPDQGAVVARLLSYANDSPHVLDPGLPREGRLNSRWGIWMNIPEDPIVRSQGLTYLA